MTENLYIWRYHRDTRIMEHQGQGAQAPDQGVQQQNQGVHQQDQRVQTSGQSPLRITSSPPGQRVSCSKTEMGHASCKSSCPGKQHTVHGKGNTNVFLAISVELSTYEEVVSAKSGRKAGAPKHSYGQRSSSNDRQQAVGDGTRTSERTCK